MVRDLNDFGITVVHCSDKAEAADHLIKSRIEKDLTAMQKSGTPPAETAFILITSDKDFTDVLRKLYFNGHKTVVVHNVEMKGTKKSEHFEKLTLFSTECFAFSDIVTWDLVHEQDAWQKVMGWASSRVQPGVRIKTPRQEVLYQGYWPESLIALPGPLALEELREIKAMGFNLVRVHATVLPAIFYHFCDQEGLLVWQDFPAGDGRALPLWDSARGTFEQSLGLNQPQADSQVLGVQMRQLTQALGLGE
eukprot:g5144.t1